MPIFFFLKSSWPDKYITFHKTPSAALHDVHKALCLSHLSHKQFCWPDDVSHLDCKFCFTTHWHGTLPSSTRPIMSRDERVSVSVLGLEYAIREVLEAIIQSCGDRVDGIVDELVEMSLKLLVGQVYMETTLQCWHNRCSRPEAC